MQTIMLSTNYMDNITTAIRLLILYLQSLKEYELFIYK